MSAPPRQRGRVLALCGGVGGAKLALGLYDVLDSDDLIVAVNTGDDFQHIGLHVSPDIDTVLYTLAGLNDRERGWGRAGESWQFMDALAQIGGEGWFMLGDKDLALHVERTHRLRSGATLGAVTADFARRLGISARIVPMSNDPVATVIETPDGALPFQRYFVERRCEPEVIAVRFDGADRARPHPDLIDALADPTLRAIVICPSNPYLSVDPMLAIPALRDALAAATPPIVAVSPIIAGKAVKGPTAKIMGELGIPATSVAIARHYRDFIDGLVLDGADAEQTVDLGVAAHLTRTLMLTADDRRTLARQTLAFADRLAGTRGIASERQMARNR
jgi:LPPG:FO 2-phospho-L-lactate transferase